MVGKENAKGSAKCFFPSIEDDSLCIAEKFICIKYSYSEALLVMKWSDSSYSVLFYLKAAGRKY